MDNNRRCLHYGWILLAVATLSVVGAIGIARFGYSMVLPTMQRGLQMDNTQAGMIASANLVGYLALALIGGALASHFGPRIVITIGLVLAGAGMLLTGQVQGFAGAAIWRTLTGIGSGASNVPTVGLVSAWFAPRRRGLATGIAVTGSSIALILLGPTVPAVLRAHPADGWRLCWTGFGAATLLIAVIAGILLRNHPRELGLCAVAETPQAPVPEAEAPGAPSSWAVVYRTPAVYHLGLVYIAFGFSYIIYMTFFVKGLIAEGNYTPEGAGNLFMIMGWASLLCGLLWGTISDSIGRKYTLVLVYLVQTVSFGLYALSPTPGGFTISAILFGLTAWSIPGIMAAACGDLLGSRAAPAAIGYITLFFGFGQAAGPTVAGIIADARGSLLPAMLLASAVALLGAGLSATLHPVHGKQDHAGRTADGGR